MPVHDDAHTDTLEIDAARENYPLVVRFLEDFLARETVGRDDRALILVANEEIFVNIADYAYGRGRGTVSLRLSCADGKVRMVYSDTGSPFNPLEAPAPDITLPAERRGEGGLGIMLVQKLMDAVAYERRDGKNLLTVVKAVRPSTEH